MTQPFLSLPRERQLELYAAAARRAVDAYALGGTSARLDLISAVNNATFAVVVDGPAPQRWALRVHRPGKTSPEALAAELRWLVALNQDTDLWVPSPVVTTDDRLWSSFTFADCPDRFDCVLFGWIDARFLPTADLTAAHAHEIGRFVARLHLHSEVFSTTPDLVRRRLDAHQFFDWAALDSLHDMGAATDAHMEVFRAVDRTTRRTLAMWGQGADVFGMIHTDLMAINYFFYDGGVGTFDFDDCSWGYYAYDMAATLIGFAEVPSYHALRAAYLDGYRSARPLSEREEAALDLMMAARHLLSCCWIATHLDSPGIAARVHTIIRTRAATIERLIAPLL